MPHTGAVKTLSRAGGAIRFVLSGANIMTPGFTHEDGDCSADIPLNVRPTLPCSVMRDGRKPRRAPSSSTRTGSNTPCASARSRCPAGRCSKRTKVRGRNVPSLASNLPDGGECGARIISCRHRRREPALPQRWAVANARTRLSFCVKTPGPAERGCGMRTLVFEIKMQAAFLRHRRVWSGDSKTGVRGPAAWTLRKRVPCRVRS